MGDKIYPVRPIPDALGPGRADVFAQADLGRAATGFEAAQKRNTLAEQIETDKVINQLSEAYNNGLIAAFDEIEPTKKTLSEVEKLNLINDWQVGSATEQAQYLKVLQLAHTKAAAQLDSSGVTSTTIAAALNARIAGLGNTLKGAGKDLSNMSTSQLLVIAGAAAGTRLLGFQSKWTIGSVAAIATIVQSPALTKGAIDLGGGLLNAASNTAQMGLVAGMRGANIIDRALSDNVLEVAQSEIGALVQDGRHAIIDTLGGDIDPQKNPILHEFMNAGRDVPPPPALKPLIDYVTALSEGRLDASTLPSRAELEAAGAFLKQADSLVSEADMNRIIEKRVTGKPLTLQEKQQYLIGKYSRAMKQAFLGEGAIEPQASVVRGVYEGQAAGAGSLTLSSALNMRPEQVEALKKEDFHLSPEAIATMNAKAEHLFGAVNFENFMKTGSGAAVSIYLAMMLLLPAIRTIAGVFEDDPDNKKETKKLEILDEQPLSYSWADPRRLKRNRYKAIDAKVEKNNIEGVYDSLVAYNVLSGDTKLKADLAKHKEALDIENAPEFADFRAKVKPGSGTSRQELRQAFITAIKTRVANETGLDSLLPLIDAAEARRQLHRDLRKFYRLAREGTGTHDLKVKIVGGETHDFKIDRENGFNERIHNVTSVAAFRGLRDKDYAAFMGPKKGFAFRHIKGGPPLSGDTSVTKAVKFVINKDGQVEAFYRKDPALNVGLTNQHWRSLGIVESLSK